LKFAADDDLADPQLVGGAHREARGHAMRTEWLRVVIDDGARAPGPIQEVAQTSRVAPTLSSRNAKFAAVATHGSLPSLSAEVSRIANWGSPSSSASSFNREVQELGLLRRVGLDVDRDPGEQRRLAFVDREPHVEVATVIGEDQRGGQRRIVETGLRGTRRRGDASLAIAGLAIELGDPLGILLELRGGRGGVVRR